MRGKAIEGFSVDRSIEMIELRAAGFLAAVHRSLVLYAALSLVSFDGFPCCGQARNADPDGIGPASVSTGAGSRVRKEGGLGSTWTFGR